MNEQKTNSSLSLYEHNIHCYLNFLEDNVKRSIQNLIFVIENKRNLIPPVIIIQGACGTGKSYITKLIIEHIKRINYKVIEYFFTNVAELREIFENYYVSFNKLCMSIEEAHTLNTMAQSFILTTLEKSKNIFVILTTSSCHLLNEALISRSYMITTDIMSKENVKKYLYFLNDKFKYKTNTEMTHIINNCHENTFRNVINYYHFNINENDTFNVIKCFENILISIKHNNEKMFNENYIKIQTLSVDIALQIIYNGIIGNNELMYMLKNNENINILLKFYANVKCFKTLRLLLLLLNINN